MEKRQKEVELIFEKLYFKAFIFKLRTKVEHFGDTPRNKITAVAISPVVYKEYNGFLVNKLKVLTGIDNQN